MATKKVVESTKGKAKPKGRGSKPPTRAPHPEYLYNVMGQALTTAGKTLNESTVLLARAVVRDMRVMAQSLPDEKAIHVFIDRYESLLLDNTGGGGGGEDENLLQGP